MHSFVRPTPQVSGVFFQVPTQLACVVSDESHESHDFPKRKQDANTQSTSNMHNPKYLYISTNYLT